MTEVCELIYTIPSEKVMLYEDKVVPNLNNTQDKTWYLDTGASNYMTGCIEKFVDIDTTIRGSVKFGDGLSVEIHGRGSVLVEYFTGEHCLLTNVYYIPKLRSNIIRLGQFGENGCKIIIEGGVMSIIDRMHMLLAKVNRSSNKLYVLHIAPALPECLMIRSKEEAWHWHARYGHVNFHALKDMALKNIVHGLPLTKHEERICDGCLIGKQHQNSFPTESQVRAKSPLDLWHVDLCGPITPTTHGDDAFVAFKKVKAAAELEKNCKLKTLRNDRSGEVNSNDFKNYCEMLGIRQYLTTPYSPQQNGVVERRNQTVVGMARSLLKSEGVPGEFWGEAVSNAVYLLNRASTKSVIGKTPYEAYYDRKPSVNHFRIFGCIAHVKVVTLHLSKLADRSKQMIFIGYDMNTKGYQMYDPTTRRVVVTRDVVFEEEKKWEWRRNP